MPLRADPVATAPVLASWGRPRASRGGAEVFRLQAQRLGDGHDVLVFAPVQDLAAATDAVAARAGVAIGTVFRRFPTKPDLLKAVVMNLRDHLVDEAEAMVRDQDDASALFEFCSLVMAVGTAQRDVFERLAETGVQVRVADALERLEPSIAVLLERAREGAAQGRPADR